jgi:hypothetical protein
VTKFSIRSPLDLEWRPHRNMMDRFQRNSVSRLIVAITKPILTRTVAFNKWELWMLVHDGKLVPLSSSKRLRVAESILKELV